MTGSIQTSLSKSRHGKPKVKPKTHPICQDQTIITAVDYEIRTA
ncbi:hypothetical protein GCM10025794_35910 [Massilia kyonggiensis]